MADKQVNIIVRAVDAVTGELRKMGDGIDSFASTVKGVFAGITAAIAALGIGKLFRDSIIEADEAEKSMARLDAALRPVGSSYKEVSTEVEAYLQNIQRTTRYSDEEAREALTHLVMATGSLQAAMADMPVTINLAARANVDLSTAADMVTKAHQGVGRELKAFGIEVKAGTDAVPELTRVLGDWEATSRTTGDRLQTVNNLWKEFKERLGAALLGGQEFGGGMDHIIEILVRAAKWIDQNSEAIGKFADFVIKFVGDAGSTLTGFLGKLVDTWTQFKDFNQELVASITRSIGIMVVGFADAVDAIGGPILNLFGIKVVDGLREKGMEMVHNSDAALAALKEGHQRSGEDVFKIASEGQIGLTDLVVTGGYKRVKATQDELKEREKAETDYQKALEAAEKESYKVRKDLLTEAYQAFLASSQGLWDKMADLQKAALAAGEADSQKYADAMRHIQDALHQTVVEFAKAELAARGVSDGMDLQIAATESLRAHTQSLNVDLDELTGMTQDELIADILAEGGKRKHKEATSELSKEVQECSRILNEGWSAIRNIAEAAGLAGEEFGAFSDGIGSVIAGIGEIASGDVLGVIGGIGGVVSGITSIANLFFGESESARRVRQALENATVSIDHLSSTLGDMSQTDQSGGTISHTQQALSSFLGAGWTFRLDRHPFEVTDQELTAALEPFGVTLAQLEDLAHDYNIDIRPNGYIDFRMLQSLMAALSNVDSGIPQNWAGQLNNLLNVASTRGDSPAQLLNSILGLLGGQYGSPYLSNAIAGLSPSQLPSALSNILANIGSLSPGDFGGLNYSQFIDIIQRLSDLARQVSGSSTGTTLPNPLDPSLPGGLPLTPFIPPITFAVGDTSPTATSPTSTTTINIGDINVNVAGTTSTADDIAAATAAALDQTLADNYTLAQQATGDVTLK